MQEVRPLLFERLGKSLHERFDEIVREPLPERWTELINLLNEEEVCFNKAEADSKPD